MRRTTRYLVFLNNTSLLGPRLSGKPVLLAYRGIAQRFDERGVTNDTCTASRVLPPIVASISRLGLNC
ncbi:hypothetical protein [Phyllobacterium sp. 22552]|uniref:hypothetical protein n=1 Tax=Phyllobacterium sp. 22552 TaxID=3453941 RepID=UPI003F866E06